MNKKKYIFGADKNGIELLECLNARGGVIAAFIDNDKSKQNTVINGIECISIEEAANRGARDSIIFIPVNEPDEVESQLREWKFQKVFSVGRWLGRLRYFMPETLNGTDYSNVVPFNYYESPYPDIVEIHKKEKELFDRNKDVLDIDFHVDRQFEIMAKMNDFELPAWPQEREDNSRYRYYYKNRMFGKGSADALYYMLRIIEPATVIEVGSGFSTAVMLDTNEYCFKNSMKLYSIEPRADRLKALLKPADNLEIYEKDLQEVPLEFFGMLSENDILFIDSSHVSKMNSDVNYLFFEILPRLKKGVYIHFHDMMYPFIYPEDWIYEGRAYNEMYILRAFLMNNKEYSIQLFGDMLHYKQNGRIPEKLQGCGRGSLWIKKES